MTETAKEITPIKTMPTTQAEQRGETTNNPPLPRQWGLLDDHILAVQCPMPGQHGAPWFGGTDISEFLRYWEWMANKYQLRMAAKIYSVVDYCSPDMRNTLNALMSMAKRQVMDETQETREEGQWNGFKTRTLKQSRNTDSVQIRQMVEYLKALAAKRDIWKDEGEVEYYINQVDDVAAELVKMRQLTRHDRMVLFLEGLPVRIVRKVSEGGKLDTKKLETFERSGVSNEVGEAALNHNRADTDYDQLGLRTNQESQAKDMVSAILKRLEWKPPTPANAEVVPPTQAPPTRPSVREDVMVGLLEDMQDLKIYMRQKWVVQEDRSPNHLARKTPYDTAAGPMIGMNDSTSFWCGNEGHIKARCPDYQNSLANRMINLPETDPRTRLGLQECGVPIVPLPMESSLWPQVWVDRERRRPESAMQQHGRIEVVTEEYGPRNEAGG